MITFYLRPMKMVAIQLITVSMSARFALLILVPFLMFMSLSDFSHDFSRSSSPLVSLLSACFFYVSYSLVSVDVSYEREVASEVHR